MIKRLALLAALTVAGLSVAQAADADYYRRQAPQKSYVDRNFNWTGFHVGVSGGWGMAMAASTNDSGWTDPNAPDWSGAVLGVNVGARKQWGALVLGVELTGMRSWANHTNTFDGCGGMCGPGFTTTQNTSTPWLTLGEVQVGFAGFNRLLPYLSGGFAGAQVKFSDASSYGEWGSSTYSRTNYALGWTVGGGLDYALLDNLSFGVKYNYVNLGVMDTSSTYSSPWWGTSNYWNRDRISQHILTAGVKVNF